MITVTGILLIILWFIAVPCILGHLIFVSVKETGESLPLTGMLPFGFMLMCAVFIVPAIPMILLHVPFHILKWSFVVMIAALCLTDIILIIRRKKSDGDTSKGQGEEGGKAGKPDGFTVCVWTAAILLIAFQACLLTFKMHTDTDDARFIVDAMEAINKDTMLEYNPITGIHHGIPVGEQIKDVTAPYPIFIAIMSVLCGIHPAIMAHTVMPMIYIPMCYLVFALIGRQIFKTDIRKRGLFLMFLALIHLFSFETIYSAGYTLLTIIWQGRSLAAMVMLPMLWYLLLKEADKEECRLRDYALIMACSLANAMMSNMGSLFAFILAMAYGLAITIGRKSLKPVVFMGLGMIPNIVCILISRVLLSGFLYR